MKSPWFADIERMNQLVREATSSPFKRLLDEMYISRQVLENFDHRMLHESPSSFALEAQRLNEGLTSAISAVVGQYDLIKEAAAADIAHSLAGDLRKIVEAVQPPPMPFIEALAGQLRSASVDLHELGHLERTFAGRFLEFARVAATAPPEEREERVENLTRFVEHHVAKPRHGPISLEAYLQILVALIFFLYSTLGMEHLEEHVTESLLELRDELKASTAAEAQGSSTELRLVSSATAILRRSPSTESQVAGRLSRKSLVRVIGKEKSWSHVEYFDFIEGSLKEAWIAHRLLEQPNDAYWQSLLSEGDDAAVEAARERFESHFGEVNVPEAVGVLNEQIDADLAREYASAHEEN